jgi:S1-C subfamily serine protease
LRGLDLGHDKKTWEAEGAARMLRRIKWFALFVVPLFFLVQPARADDVSAASRSVVRVVVVAFDYDGDLIDFSHGSGFAISPNQVVTNDHVIELARRFPNRVAIGVVPSEGEKSYGARLVSYDRFHDLAVLRLEGHTLPSVPLYVGPLAEGSDVVALGYPGAVDRVTARNILDYIKPAAPMRSKGAFSNKRDWQGTDTLLHTAPMAGGNSGGPLVDACGRVVGVNTITTRSGDGEASFGFAVSVQELMRLLQADGLKFETTASECVSMAEHLSREEKRQAQEAQELREEEETRRWQQKMRVKKHCSEHWPKMRTSGKTVSRYRLHSLFSD